ncbi:MAG: hypothetical protein IPK73_10890 [Candidatus Obscuribacter sp.]|nr:hypothetical protein [Candidatus Obscuribacter sp.]MBK9281521.1 hypothetical protein [Candidatus Obscuribacter sp.]MBL8083734.1 hypothetical protein [Candidatus Obscuribacter sp.]
MSADPQNKSQNGASDSAAAETRSSSNNNSLAGTKSSTGNPATGTQSSTRNSATGTQSGTYSGLKDSPIMTWPLIRRLESAAFMAMFLAVPLFAFRVVDYTARQLALNNAAHELVKDIRRVKEMSSSYDMPITVESARSKGGQSCYVIRSDRKTIEEVILPRGVTVVGGVTFGSDGKPNHPASFDVSMEHRSLLVNVDMSGVASMP